MLTDDAQVLDQDVPGAIWDDPIEQDSNRKVQAPHEESGTGVKSRTCNRVDPGVLPELRLCEHRNDSLEDPGDSLDKSELPCHQQDEGGRALGELPVLRQHPFIRMGAPELSI